jgi:hypothetical protein
LLLGLGIEFLAMVDSFMRALRAADRLEQQVDRPTTLINRSASRQ